MTAGSIFSLVTLAVTTGFIHTVAGPDHYLPFVAISKARAWSRTRTLLVTAICGVGHVLGSVILGAIGIAAGIAVSRLEVLEAARGDIAAWLMIAFGLIYASWGLQRSWRNRRHEHAHAHADGQTHSHVHVHHKSHVHVHADGTTKNGQSITPWVLFTIFVFGPCEVLIPQLMFPAAIGNPGVVVLVVLVFGVTTILTMLGMVLLLTTGLKPVQFNWLQRHTHALAGATVAACGGLILLGL